MGSPKVSKDSQSRGILVVCFVNQTFLSVSYPVVLVEVTAYCFSTLTDIDFMQQFDKHHGDYAFVRSKHFVESITKIQIISKKS